ncbi:hypothetical protein [Paenibacillus campi]|uniref:hypothetical protein n=1 Tax=Paenibacillus campi TaxID=3106031 RepID=UPI002AFE1302|nr:hypothetical protein [Paenibacillus sp. SGZ-1014]
MQNSPAKPNLVISFLESLGLKQSFIYKLAMWLFTGPYAILKMISATVTATTTLGYYFYSLGYLFIYGYYLSGEITTVPSLFALSINPIPLNEYSVTIISVYLFIATFGIFFAMVSLKQTKLYSLVMVLPILFLLHIGLSLFFLSSYHGANQSLQFLIIWIIPLFLALNIFALIKATKFKVLFLSGIIYSSFLGSFILHYFGIINKAGGLKHGSLGYIMLTVFIIPFLAAIYVMFLQKRYKRTISRVIVLFPFTFIGVVSLYAFFEFITGYNVFMVINKRIEYFFDTDFFSEWKFKLLLVLPIAWILNIFFCRLLKKKQRFQYRKELEQQRLQNTNDNNENIKWDANTRKVFRSIVLFVIPCVFIAICAIPPILSLIAGNYIRTFSPTGVRQIEVIEDYTNHKTIKGMILKIEGDIYYISNEKWELEILKTDHIHVTTEK